ncbi:MAG: Omp28-related outer membrane protein [Candidatus Kapaibacterium sp.]
MRYIVAAVLITASAFLGCDEVSTPYEKKGNVDPVDTTGYGQHVLLEEFTGHTCRNCPVGHKVAEQLRGLYGEKIVTMAIHAGAFALPEAEYPEDFRTAAGDALNTLFKVSSYPAGVVNRSPVSGQYVQSSVAWASLVDTLSKGQSPFKITLTPTFDGSSKAFSLGVRVQTRAPYSSTKPVSMMWYIVEDSVIAPQLNFNTRVPTYLHRDMLRDAPMGVYGKSFFTSTTIPANTKKDTTLTYSFASVPYVPEKCKAIVVMALPDPDYRVLQVSEVHVAGK